MNIKSQEIVEPGICNVTLSGKITSRDDYDAINALIQEQLEGDVKKFALNFAEITFINSGGLGTLFQIAKLIAEVEGKISFYQMDGQMKELFNITLLSKKIPLADNKNAALDILKG